jgi:hypothetical protein
LIQWYYVAGEGAKGDRLVETLTQRVLADEEVAIKKGDRGAMQEGYSALESIANALNSYGRSGEVRQRLLEAEARCNMHF